MVAMQESQQKMWGTIERISNDLQELAQTYIGTEEEEGDKDLVPTITNPDELGLAPTATTSWFPLQMEPGH